MVASPGKAARAPGHGGAGDIDDDIPFQAITYAAAWYQPVVLSSSVSRFCS